VWTFVAQHDAQTDQEPEAPQDVVIHGALEELFSGLASDDQRRRIDAASGIMNYYLAKEIGNLIAIIRMPVQDPLYTPNANPPEAV
jgi:hypothetical protein